MLNWWYWLVETTREWSMLSMFLRLTIALIVGTIIGIDREMKRRSAGIKTHVLVCLGAAIVMMTSQYMMQWYGLDAADLGRMGAQVISGVGFLGAGSIIIDQTKNNKIKGITTAAGIWTTACIGLIIGMGYYIVAVFMFLLMIFTMLGLKPLTKKLQLKVNSYNIHAEAESKERIDEIRKTLRSMNVIISSFSMEKNQSVYIMDIELKSNVIMNKAEFVDTFSQFSDVKKIVIS